MKMVNKTKLYVCILSVILLLTSLKTKAASYAELQKELADYFGNVTEKPTSPVTLDFVEKPLLTFALISDSHIGRKDQLASNCMPERVIEALNQINSFRPDFLIDCGDMTTGFPGFEDHQAELTHALYLYKSHSKVPVHFAPGNHDVGNKQSSLHDYKVSEENIRAYRRYFGADYYSFDHQGCHFICLNNQLFGSDLKQADKQWEWLNEDLKKSAGCKAVYVFMHYPLFLNDPETDPGPSNYEVVDNPERMQLLKLFKKYNVDIVFTGHTHWPIHNYMPDIEFHTLYSPSFTRVFKPDNFQTMYDKKGAWRYNPYKVGYYIARVYPDKTVTQFVQSYPKLANTEKCQKNNSFDSFRMLPLAARELSDSFIGVNILLPEIVYWQRSKKQRDYTISQPVELPAQQGVKLMRIKKPFISGQNTKELERLLTLGTPRGAEIILTVTFDRKSERTSLPFENEISLYQVAAKDNEGKAYSPSIYAEIVNKAVNKFAKKHISLAAGDFDISQPEQIDSFLRNLDVKLEFFAANCNISSIDSEKYKSLVNKLFKIFKKHNQSPKVWISLSDNISPDSVLEMISKKQAEKVLKFIMLNQKHNIYTFIDSHNDKNLTMLNHDYDPTYLYYMTGVFNSLIADGVENTADPDIQIAAGSQKINKTLFTSKAGDKYLCLYNGKSGSVDYTNIILNKRDCRLYYVEPLNGIVTQLQTSGKEKTIAENVRIPDYPIFIKIEKDK